MGDWKLTRVIDNDREFVFTFPSKFTLKAGKSVRVSEIKISIKMKF